MEMSGEDAARFLDQVIDRIESGAREALAETQAEAMELARDYSSGPYSAKDLRRMGHPFARRHGTTTLDPSVINVQTGVFERGWQSEPVRETNDGLSAVIVNATPEAEFMGGTRTMFGRPIGERVEQEVTPALERRLNERTERALQP